MYRDLSIWVLLFTGLQVVLGGGQDASSVTTTDHRAGKFEAKFYHKVNEFLSMYQMQKLKYFSYCLIFVFLYKILEEEIGGVKGHFGPINALAFNPDGKRYGSVLK